MAIARDQRMALIRRKNVAFDALSRATMAYHRRSRYGLPPAAWRVRLAELEAEYQAALRALGRG